MKRRTAQLDCGGSRNPNPVRPHIPDGLGLGVCGVCLEQMPFIKVNGLSAPKRHHQKKRNR